MEFALRLEGVPSLSIPISTGSQSTGGSVLQHYHCNDCDENYDNNNKNCSNNNIIRYCTICGSELTPIYSNIDNNDNDNNHRNLLDSLFEFLGSDLRDEIENAMNNSSSSRSISQSYLDTLGKVVLDSRKGLLYDITIRVGPFKVMGIPASFGILPSTITSEIVIGIPQTGDQRLQEQVKDKIVLLKRGVVSFAQKAINAQKSGCIALVIGQTADIWPFVMSDTTKELDTFELNIPVLMISKQDCSIIEKMLNSKSEDEAHSNQLFACHIDSGEIKTDCSICQEEMIENETVLKLACRHTYHQQCVTNWLLKHNTCPLCRLEMPKEDKIKKTNTRQNPEDNHRLPYFR